MKELRELGHSLNLLIIMTLMTSYKFFCETQKLQFFDTSLKSVRLCERANFTDMILGKILVLFVFFSSSIDNPKINKYKTNVLLSFNYS